MNTLSASKEAQGLPISVGAGGSNQSRVRAHNERLVLSHIRHGALSRAEIARRTGLSAQTITLITRALAMEDLIIPGEPVRGKVGQPSVPLALNPEGAYFLGLKIGRRSTELILMNFTGQVVQHWQEFHSYPAPQDIVAFLSSRIPQVTQDLGSAASDRLHGLGIAMPYEMWNWSEQIGAPVEVMDQWRDFSFAEALCQITSLPIFVENDATAACGAELTFGNGKLHDNFAYFFIGNFIGGGIVLNGSVYKGPGGNAGAFGTLPVLNPREPGVIAQLIDTASIHLLESSAEIHAALHGRHLNHDSPVWHTDTSTLLEWIDCVNKSLAMAITSVACVADIDAVLIDGGFPDHIRNSIVNGSTQALTQFNTRGIRVPQILPGATGTAARALGAARLPLFARFLLDESVLTHDAEFLA